MEGAELAPVVEMVTEEGCQEGFVWEEVPEGDVVGGGPGIGRVLSVTGEPLLDGFVGEARGVFGGGGGREGRVVLAVLEVAERGEVDGLEGECEAAEVMEAAGGLVALGGEVEELASVADEGGEGVEDGGGAGFVAGSEGFVDEEGEVVGVLALEEGDADRDEELGSFAGGEGGERAWG